MVFTNQGGVATATPVVRTASYGAPVVTTGAPIVTAPMVSAPITSTVSYAEPIQTAPSRGYLLLSPSDREEMLKEKYTWDEVYKVINRGGIPCDLVYPRDKTDIQAFEEDRNQTRKSSPLNEEVQKRIDRAAQAVAETCLDGAETRRVEAVRMSGGVDRTALDRKKQLLQLCLRCMAPDDKTDPVTEAAPADNVPKYINASRRGLEKEGKFSEEVYHTLKLWYKLAVASEKTDYMLNEVIEVEPELAVTLPVMAAPVTTVPVTTTAVPHVEQAFSHQAYTAPAFSQTVFHN